MTRSLSPATSIRCSASAFCSLDSVTERTVAPRWAARMHSSPQPVPISSTRVPAPTPVWSSSRSSLRRWARHEVGTCREPGVRCGGDGGAGRGGPRRPRRVDEQRRAVGHRLVEERGEHVVGQVVVPRDVVAGVLLGTALGLGVPGDDERAQLLQRLGDEGGDVPAQLGEEATEVLRRPSRRPCRTRRSRSACRHRRGGRTRPGGGSAWSGCRARRHPTRRRRRARRAPAAVVRRRGTALSRPWTRRGCARTRASARGPASAGRRCVRWAG